MPEGQPQQPTKRQPRMRLYDRNFNLLWSDETSDLTLEGFLRAEAADLQPPDRIHRHISVEAV